MIQTYHSCVFGLNLIILSEMIKFNLKENILEEMSKLWLAITPLIFIVSAQTIPQFKGLFKAYKQAPSDLIFIYVPNCQNLWK